MNSDLSMLFTANRSVDYPFWRVLRPFFFLIILFFCFCVGGWVTGDGGAEVECGMQICVYVFGIRE